MVRGGNGSQNHDRTPPSRDIWRSLKGVQDAAGEGPGSELGPECPEHKPRCAPQDHTLASPQDIEDPPGPLRSSGGGGPYRLVVGLPLVLLWCFLMSWPDPQPDSPAALNSVVIGPHHLPPGLGTIKLKWHSKGEQPVEEIPRVLCPYSAHMTYLLHEDGLEEARHLTIGFRVELMNLQNALQNREVNWEPWSETMPHSMPKSGTHVGTGCLQSLEWSFEEAKSRRP